MRVNATTTFGETPFAFLARVEEILDTQGLINSLRLLASCGGDVCLSNNLLFQFQKNIKKFDISRHQYQTTIYSLHYIMHVIQVP